MISGIIMASGFASRMKSEKLLLEVGGVPIIERVIRAAVNSRLDEVVLIYRKDSIKEIASRYKIKALYNDKADRGQSEAIKVGIEASSHTAKGYMFFVGDQPFIDSTTVNALIDRFVMANNKIIIPLYNNRRGNPIVFPSCFKPDLLGLKGDIGGRAIINSNLDRISTLDIKREYIGFDIDTIEDYTRILEWR